MRSSCFIGAASAPADGRIRRGSEGPGESDHGYGTANVEGIPHLMRLR